MRKTAFIVASTVALAMALHWAVVHTHADWDGVDKTVVEKYARAAGRPPRAPLINTDQGDLLLFLFLVAGAAGGFIGGYYFRELFPARKERT
jgi:ABC-type cobalt transport system substrate-binding protein